MNHYHVCVWIDHYEAKIFGVGTDTVETIELGDHGPHHHIHRRADHVHLGTEPVDADFLGDIAQSLTAAKAILICGPGKARYELAGFLNDRHPAIGKRIWAVAPMDHPTNAQIIAAAREFFRAADPMHA